MNCRMVPALFSMTHSIAILPTEFLTAIEMLSLYVHPIYLVRERLKTCSKGAPFYKCVGTEPRLCKRIAHFTYIILQIIVLG